MDVRKIIIAAACFVAVTLVVSTTAISPDMISHLETDALELEPAGEGTYTQIDDTGEIQIIVTEENPNLDGDGVNAEAITDLGPVFEIQNVLKQQRAATVWIDHSSDAVTFTDADGNEIQSQSDGVELQPGDNQTVNMQVDTRGVDKIELGGITVKATLEPPAETGGPGGNEGGGVGASTDGLTQSSTTETVTIEDSTAIFTASRVSQIDFENDVEGEVTVEEIDSLPAGVPEPDGYVVAADISVPEDAEDEPATVRFTVSSNRISGPPEDVRLLHYTGEEWETLSTEHVGGSSGGELVFEAETPGFSLFALTVVDGGTAETTDSTATPNSTASGDATETAAADAPTDTESDGVATGEQAGLGGSPWLLVVALVVSLLAGVALYRYRIRTLD
jgi:PGF-pre-PGF domain-containing protein